MAIISCLLLVLTLGQMYLYGQGKNHKFYKWAGPYSLLCAGPWLYYTYQLGHDGIGMLILSILNVFIHLYNTKKNWSIK